MSSKRRQYTKEFKKEAVALVVEQGYSIHKAAESLGIHPTLLNKWKRSMESEQSGRVFSESEREELKRLRKETQQPPAKAGGLELRT